MNQIKVLLTGANGQLGQSITTLQANYTNITIIPQSSKELDITDRAQLINTLNKHKPSYLVNAAAYTNVDKAESDDNLAIIVNGTALEDLASECKKRAITLLHISTDYVFSGDQSTPYNPNDICNPINMYGKSKLIGEKLILNTNPDSFIIRTSWVFSEFKSNFVKTILKLTNEKNSISVVDDQIGRPTYASDLAKFILDFIINYKTFDIKNNIIHFANSGNCSWFDFSQKIIEYGHKLKLIHNIPYLQRAKTHHLNLKAQRPAYSVLNTADTEKVFNIKIRNWENALYETLNILADEYHYE
ncbi:dTDP-4-dehydrorhamnose reductase [Endozoicomonas sp. SM1973]|uniref:dTDP-4-dehydrorhamnose reductase n=1 Tax=Spartinivicinus marinus TaxID=2994442 RepID=A0A853IBI4_9GAMM|nr:dTDP-4-dehydrorhamnose reductase [Spartinivicinus marinus]MCX4026102.1 dTDP-4-dehydrorhamnose reductase [Spartinivicinus marinus]NYZ66585.1 dTDP-4-dehydrorhamnose reductase [Spartinivicinus marinus]